MNQWKFNRKRDLFAGIVFGVFVLAMILAPAEENAESTETSRPDAPAAADTDGKASEPDVHGAWAYMQQFVEQRIDPRPAEFRYGGYRDVEPLGDGRFRVDSYVDTENRFGAAVRLHFDGVIERIDGGWRLARLDLAR